MSIARKITVLAISLLLVFACKQKAKVEFDASFKGSRLDSVIKLNDYSYKLSIKPAFEPVNRSPYYAFSITSDTPKGIEVILDYGMYKHRYIPKLSTDKKVWKKIDPKNISIDSSSGNATLKLNVTTKKIFVAAQEIETSKDTYLWVDKLLKKHQKLKKIVAGKTVMQKDNYCLAFENNNSKNAIVLVARQHPPETPGGTIGFKEFFEELLSDTDVAITFRNHFNMYTFPLVNPDGSDMGNWRHNANGVDLNRDWIAFTQPETQTVKKYIEKKALEGVKIRFALDFHTSYSGPYLLVLDTLSTKKTTGIIPQWIQNIESNSSFNVEARPRSQELPYCYNYFINTFNCEAVTYEDGDEIDRDIIRKRARVYAQNLMKTMLDKLENNEL